MSKSSTVTVRTQPVAGAASVSGNLSVRSETFTIDTADRVQILDLTDRVMTLVHGMPSRKASCRSSRCTPPAPCSSTNSNRRSSTTSARSSSAPWRADGPWTHNDPAVSDCDRSNADSHLRTLLLGRAVTIQVGGGEMVLGQWQRVLTAELDGPRRGHSA